MNDPSVLGLGTNVLQSNINSPVAQAAGFTPPYAGFNGTVAQALREYPQYQTIQWRGVPTGESQYHAMEVVLERRFSRGLQARFGYTYSRLHNNGAESAQGNNGVNGGVQNPAGPAGMAAQCRRHAARVPHRLHLGVAGLGEMDLGGEKGPPGRLERQPASSATRAAGRSTSR